MAGDIWAKIVHILLLRDELRIELSLEKTQKIHISKGGDTIYKIKIRYGHLGFGLWFGLVLQLNAGSAYP